LFWYLLFADGFTMFTLMINTTDESLIDVILHFDVYLSTIELDKSFNAQQLRNIQTIQSCIDPITYKFAHPFSYKFFQRIFYK
jgi:hypothetical protein